MLENMIGFLTPTGLLQLAYFDGLLRWLTSMAYFDGLLRLEQLAGSDGLEQGSQAVALLAHLSRYRLEVGSVCKF